MLKQALIISALSVGIGLVVTAGIGGAFLPVFLATTLISATFMAACSFIYNCCCKPKNPKPTSNDDNINPPASNDDNANSPTIKRKPQPVGCFGVRRVRVGIPAPRTTIPVVGPHGVGIAIPRRVKKVVGRVVPSGVPVSTAPHPRVPLRGTTVRVRGRGTAVPRSKTFGFSHASPTRHVVRGGTAVRTLPSSRSSVSRTSTGGTRVSTLPAHFRGK